MLGKNALMSEPNYVFSIKIKQYGAVLYDCYEAYLAPLMAVIAIIVIFDDFACAGDLIYLFQ